MYFGKDFAAVSLGCYRADCEAVWELIFKVIRCFRFACCYLNLEVICLIAIMCNGSGFHLAVLSSVGDSSLSLSLAVCNFSQMPLLLAAGDPVSLPQDCKAQQKYVRSYRDLLLFGFVCFTGGKITERNLWESLWEMSTCSYLVTGKPVARTFENPFWRPCLWRVHDSATSLVCAPWICSRELCLLLLPWLFVIHR